MTDLIARLEKRLDYHIGHDEKNCTETVTLADFPAILHALKVQEAAEKWAEAREVVANSAPVPRAAWDEMKLADKALLLAVKGEQG